MAIVQETNDRQAEAPQFGGAYDLSMTLAALAAPPRLLIMHMLRDADDNGIRSCDFIAPLGLTQATVSHHLRLLAEVGLILHEKKGVWVMNWANVKLIEGMIDTLRDHLLPAKKRRRA
jgi:ArsR family transcriptional regulator